MIAIYLVSANPCKELMKLPLLVAHFYDHKEEDNKTKLIAFLIQHYYTENGTDNDANEDNKLPFKSVENITSAPVYLLPAFQSSIFFTAIQVKDMGFFIRNDSFIHSQYLAAIWQPPRYC
ncbi:hypothetical protein LK994_04375 [Ferruginibacter lapsinanis]|uniref:hypothetical protein n=1 Tax=Ferruginibacter lapsinanis TaxID=563172 RepID=UPI001E2A6A36|nr:hypothetical protein [Ferruginibacter lapsinanis]UEG50708.1 hypothetical protein LK994_04375 [Ferruginibacter lapsinanis]